MDLVKLVAVGLGVMIYVGSSIFVRRLKRWKKGQKDEVKAPVSVKPIVVEAEAVEPIETVEPTEAVEPIEPHPDDGRAVKGVVEKDVLSTVATQPVKVEEPPAAKPKAPSRARPSPPSTADMEWFLIRAKTGSVRVVQARGKTPKTVAGPFPTKEEAHKARALELARASVSPKGTKRRPKGKSRQAGA
ncbi:MAG: hypothetical protein P8182_20530 [Deltaproteobacteria bacterium]